MKYNACLNSNFIKKMKIKREYIGGSNIAYTLNIPVSIRFINSCLLYTTLPPLLSQILDKTKMATQIHAVQPIQYKWIYDA